MVRVVDRWTGETVKTVKDWMEAAEFIDGHYNHYFYCEGR